MMDQHAEQIARIATNMSYGASLGLIFGDTMQFLNQNAAACGVILGVLTFVVNVHFQIKNHNIIKAANGDRRKK